MSASAGMASMPRFPFVAMQIVPTMAKTTPKSSRRIGARRAFTQVMSMMRMRPHRSNTVAVPALLTEIHPW